MSFFSIIATVHEVTHKYSLKADSRRPLTMSSGQSSLRPEFRRYRVALVRKAACADDVLDNDCSDWYLLNAVQRISN
jgi:hypothetical protein